MLIHLINFTLSYLHHVQFRRQLHLPACNQCQQLHGHSQRPLCDLLEIFCVWNQSHINSTIFCHSSSHVSANHPSLQMFCHIFCTCRVWYHVFSCNVFEGFWNPSEALLLGAQCCACNLVHNKNMAALALLMVVFLSENQAPFCIEIHVPTYASAKPYN